MTVNERQLIADAADRLLAGRPLRSNGALTVLALAEEAGVKRHLLTHRHTDLKDEFYARVRAQGSIPVSELELRGELDRTKIELKAEKAKVRALEAQLNYLSRVNNVLEVENLRLREAGQSKKASRLRALATYPEPD